MNNHKFFSIALATGAALALLAGCGQQKSPRAAEGQDPAGHPHAQQAPPRNASGLSGLKCAAHNAPKELCFICDASLREKGRLWCQEHSRYEDRCFLCHPELQDKKRLWCKEHSLYEDECYLCRPELKSKSASGTVSAQVLMCSEHHVPETECGICRPEVLATLKPGEGMKVRLAAADSADMAGVETAPPRPGAISDTVECYAELAFNQNKLAHIAAPVGGIVQEVAVDVGATVGERQLLTKIWSATIAEAVAKAVLSHQTLEREQKLRNERVTPQKDLQQAEAEHRAACQQLRTLGFTEEQIDELQDKPQEEVMMEVQAPFAGDIVERAAVRGALVESGKTLFTVADLSVMWAMLNIPESALARVKVGQSVELRVESFPERTFTGKLTWIAAEVDEKSRMVRARAELQNPDRLLKARMFARARILTRTNPTALLLPAGALQHSGGKTFVFVQLDRDLFEARIIGVGATLDSQVEIKEGLKAGEPTVVAHGFPLKSALLISRLGAGCADD